jgi:hypothetical protein
MTDPVRDAHAAVADAEIEGRLLELLAARATGSSICPSDVARSLAPDSEMAWRGLMPRVRLLAVALAREDRIESPAAGCAFPWTQLKVARSV